MERIRLVKIRGLLQLKIASRQPLLNPTLLGAFLIALGIHLTFYFLFEIRPYRGGHLGTHSPILLEADLGEMLQQREGLTLPRIDEAGFLPRIVKEPNRPHPSLPNLIPSKLDWTSLQLNLPKEILLDSSFLNLSHRQRKWPQGALLASYSPLEIRVSPNLQLETKWGPKQEKKPLGELVKETASFLVTVNGPSGRILSHELLSKGAVPHLRLFHEKLHSLCFKKNGEEVLRGIVSFIHTSDRST